MSRFGKQSLDTIDKAVEDTVPNNTKQSKSLVWRFSVGDELGFKESISNVEMNRRRSTSGTKLQAQIIQAQQDAARSRNTILVRKPTSPTMELSLKPTNTSPTTLQISMKKSNIVPLFKPIPSAPERPSTSSNSPKMANPSPAVMGTNLPAVNKLTSSNNHNVMTIVAVPKLSMSPQAISDKIGTNTFALRTLPTKNHELLFQESSNSLNTLLKTNNVTEEDIEAALWKRQLILNKMQARTSTTYRPITPTHAKSEGKVMNAPKEYYPVGYDKNFDDNFASRVELPETSFYCGDQKHFPGLYADEDLGCMVFHVCALTDDGLIMKSFLCPESTLFDQTVLKCNWWFYVDDCKNSKKLYDSNIPISKSYQLMKALTFFSAYKKEVPTTQKTIAKD